MTTFKVVSVYIFTDCLPCFSDIVILGQICFLVLEASEPSFNHDIVSPPAFTTIHALTDLELDQSPFHSYNSAFSGGQPDTHASSVEQTVVVLPRPGYPCVIDL